MKCTLQLQSSFDSSVRKKSCLVEGNIPDQGGQSSPPHEPQCNISSTARAARPTSHTSKTLRGERALGHHKDWMLGQQKGELWRIHPWWKLVHWPWVESRSHSMNSEIWLHIDRGASWSKMLVYSLCLEEESPFLHPQSISIYLWGERQKLSLCLPWDDNFWEFHLSLAL